MIEAMIVLPLLVIFFMGILEAGRTSSTIARAAQTAYNAALLGGKTSRAARFGAMNQRANDLNTFMVRDLVNVSMSATEDTANRTVSFSYQGDLQALLPNMHWGVGLSFTGPDLILSSASGLNLNEFGNGSCYYDCSLNRTATCPVVGGHSCGGGIPQDPRGGGGEFEIDPDGKVGGGIQQVRTSPVAEAFMPLSPLERW